MSIAGVHRESYFSELGELHQEIGYLAHKCFCSSLDLGIKFTAEEQNKLIQLNWKVRHLNVQRNRLMDEWLSCLPDRKGK